MSRLALLGLFLLGLAAAAHAAEPLEDLPSKPQGAHLAKIKALGENAWVDLGSPAPDPKWGKARGRSWSCRAPFAPDLRGAFYFGEGPHGMAKPDGHYMDDLWFYDVNQHRWICVYPGIKAKGGYREMGIKLNEDGFEVTPDGRPLPIAAVGHGYCAMTYDTDRKLFLTQPTFQHYWRIEGRLEYLLANREEFFGQAGGKVKGTMMERGASASPWIYDTAEGHWERFRTKGKQPGWGSGCTLVYVPTVKKAFGYMNKNKHIAWYDPAARDWTPIEKRGKLPPWNIDPNSCYDSRRDRIYLGGGLYPVIEKGQSALWGFDVKTETFSRLEPKGAPASTNYSTNRAIMNYDSVNDVVVLLHARARKGEVPGVYVYHPGRNEWETACQRPPELVGKGNPTWTGFYDPELNVHFVHIADDGRDNGVMRAYRYKRGTTGVTGAVKGKPGGAKEAAR
ncbi:MAG: hypothetical protein ACYTGB_07560 [Planctomycetota bacterium]|jgi:hypothetical protein